MGVHFLSSGLSEVAKMVRQRRGCVANDQPRSSAHHRLRHHPSYGEALITDLDAPTSSVHRWSTDVATNASRTHLLILMKQTSHRRAHRQEAGEAALKVVTVEKSIVWVKDTHSCACFSQGTSDIQRYTVLGRSYTLSIIVINQYRRRQLLL